MAIRIGAIAILSLILSACASYTDRMVTPEDEAALAAIPVDLSPAARKVFVEKTLVTNGAKAFAASPDGSSGYGRRYHDLANAEKAALNNCSNRSTTCKIVYAVQSATPPLENGIRLSDNVYQHYELYISAPNPKVFVIGYGGHFNSGVGADLEQLKQDVLFPCSAAMKERTYPDGCVVLSVNGDLLDIDQPMRPTLP